ncbi:DUF3347 domain-containing protein [Roseivirga pacifica]|uniref:DUF3347 domain-containing protein n=1 Tax=Roseivirga pacifica TaxID=1267423 RepID=UPI003BB02996
MRNTLLIIAFACLVASCGGTQTETNPLDNYFAIKDALVATDAVKAQEAANTFIASTDNPVFTAALEKIANTTDVKAQRAAFDALSESMYAFVKSKSISSEQPIYKQYCPMAFNDEGAFWLSAQKEVRNPYFGDMMLTCGSVQETLNQ